MIDVSFNLYSFEYFLLVLIRIASFMVAAPFYGLRNIPARTKIGLALFVSILIYGSIDISSLDLNDAGTLSYGILVGQEALTGLFVGFAANVCSYIILFAGNMIDTNIGLAMAQEYDPINHTQATLSANLYNYLVLLLLLVSDMHRFILRAIVDTYDVIPMGGAQFHFDELYKIMLSYIVQLFVIAFRIILPVWSCIMVVNIVLGIMAKVAPQMNMFAVGIQIKVLIGFTVMLLTVFLLPNISDFIFKQMKTMIRLFTAAMTPGQ